MKNLFAILIVLILVSPTVLLAHESWIEADDFYPEAGKTYSFRICSGHYFPASNLVLKDDVISELFLYGPGMEVEYLESVKKEKFRTGSFVSGPEGVYLLCFVLKRPKATVPSFEAKAIIISGSNDTGPGSYMLGRGLELVPDRAVLSLRVKEELGLMLYLDGKRVGGPVTVFYEDSKSSYSRSGIEKPAVISIHKCGSFLATASYEGRNCSLRIRIPDGATERTQAVFKEKAKGED